MGRKAAMELSLGTIVIVVLSLALLILGFILVRSIMCGAISATEGINAKTRSQIDSLFESTAGDVTCIGAGSDPGTFVAGRAGNYIICSIKSSGDNKYRFSISYNDVFGSIEESRVRNWIDMSREPTLTLSANDREPKKIYPLHIPSTAPEGELGFDIEVEIKEEGSSNYEHLWTGILSYKVEQPGAIKGFMC